MNSNTAHTMMAPAPTPHAPAPDDSAIVVRDLTKSFTIHDGATSAAEAMANAFKPKNLFRRNKGRTFTAVNGVSFDVQPGESVGLIGRNGAGKSTLLKVLARVTPPTSGSAAFRGSVGSLLEVGAGFHGELTGRENIFLNGAILGMRASDVRESFDDIVEFAGIGKFLETPVKRYSSGMYVRLAFAVAAHLRNDILLVDEVLAVGDTTFQQQSLEKMSSMAREGRTIVFVSHHMPSVRQLCSRGIVLEQGRLHYDGPVDQATEAYRTLQENDRAARLQSSNEGSTEFPQLAFLTPTQATYRPDEAKTFEFQLNRGKTSAQYTLCFILRDDTGNAVTMPESRSVGVWFDADKGYRGTFTLERPWLAPGRYSFDVWLHTIGDSVYGACEFTVTDESPYEFITDSWVAELSPVYAEFKVAAEPITATSAAHSTEQKKH